MRGQKGFALVISLVIMFLLVGLVMEFVNEVYVDASHSHNFVAAQQASILSEAGMQVGKMAIELSPMINGSSNYSSLLDPWAKPLKHEAEEGTLIVNIEEESGKFNLNLATTPNGEKSDYYTDAAIRLFKKLGLPAEDLIDAVRDWVDIGDAPNPGGAETAYYSGLKFPYKAKNSRLETVEELALVKGFTPAVVAKLKPYITVYGTNNDDKETGTKININTAPREVIASLDESMNDRLVDAILDYRKTKPIKGQSDLLAIPGMDAVIPKIVLRITYGGAVYRIRAEGHVKDSVSVTEAVIRTGTNVPLYWREY